MSKRPKDTQESFDFVIESTELVSQTSSLFVAPRIIMASSLFTARNKNQPRAHIKQQLLVVAPGHGEVRYRGEELRQYDDRKVWQAIIELARENKIHTTDFTLTCSVYQLLKKVGWSSGGKDYAHLKECLERLKATALTAMSTSGNEIKSVSLIGRFTISGATTARTAESKISLDPEIYKLFQRGDVTFLSMDIMKEMPVLTHKVYEITKANCEQKLSVEEYMHLSGNDYKNIRQFKAKLKAALGQLKHGGYIKDWEISADNIVETKEEAPESLVLDNE